MYIYQDALVRSLNRIKIAFMRSRNDDYVAPYTLWVVMLLAQNYRTFSIPP